MIVKGNNFEDFERCPAGTHQAICKGVFDLGNQRVVWQGQEKITPKLILVFEVNVRMQKGDNAGKRFNVSKQYTASLGMKANLRKDLESWRARGFTKEEVEAGFDMEKLGGVNCLLSITQDEKNGKTYTNIKSIMKLPKDMPEMQLEIPFETIPEWIQNIQAKAVPDIPDIVDNRKPAFNEGTYPEKHINYDGLPDIPDPVVNKTFDKVTNKMAKDVAVYPNDDDIPF
jgi:hypothetical protein